ncbi:hypothetical protein Tco_0590616 [Tanacetum coccineum]
MRNMINLHTIRDDSLLGTLKFVSKTQDYQQYGALILDDMINQDIKDYKAYKTCLDFDTGKATPKKARKFKKVASPSRKLSIVLEEEPAVKPKQAKRPTKKSTTMLTTSVVIRDTPSESVPKKKTPTKVDRSNGMDLLSDVASLKAAQFKKTLNKSKLELTSSCNYSLMVVGSPTKESEFDKSVKEIIKDEVKSQLPKILPKEVSNYATPVIQSSITESLKNIVLAKSSSQPKSTYEAAELLTEFELKKILLDKIQKSKSCRGAQEHKDLYDALVKSYKLDKDLFESYGKVYSLKRDREDKDKDEDPPTGSDQGLKKRKTRKNAKPSRGSKSKESKSSISKGSKSQPKSSGKSAQAEEPVFETTDTEMPLSQGEALEENLSFTFDELMSTPIDFSAYVMNNLKIENLTQEYLVGPAFNLLKGTCKSRVELESRSSSSACKLLLQQRPRISKGRSSSRKYTTFTTKPSFYYENIEGIEDMVPSLWSPVKHDVFSTKRIIAVTHLKVMKWYDYGYLEEIEVRREEAGLQVQRRDVIYNLNVALRMFTKRVVILKRVEDLQLGVESYQKKLNITKPETFRFFMILLPA